MAFIEENDREAKTWSRKDLKTFYSQLSNLKGIKDNDLNYAIARTLDHLKGIADAIDDSKRIPQTDEFNLFIEEKQRLLKELSKGKVKQIGGQEMYDIDFTDEKIIKAIEDLEKEHSQAIKERGLDIEMYNKWILGDITEKVKLHKIHSNKIPEGSDLEVWKICSPMIIYDEDTEQPTI